MHCFQLLHKNLCVELNHKEKEIGKGPQNGEIAEWTKEKKSVKEQANKSYIKIGSETVPFNVHFMFSGGDKIAIINGKCIWSAHCVCVCVCCVFNTFV